jgi:hypothetical protein
LAKGSSLNSSLSEAPGARCGWLARRASSKAIQRLHVHSLVPYPNDPDIFNGSPVFRSHLFRK